VEKPWQLCQGFSFVHFIGQILLSVSAQYYFYGHLKNNRMREIQFREALREAMNEEMRRDDRVLLMGEEVAEYNGAYKVSQGMLDEFGPERVLDTPISELGFAGVGVGAAMNGPLEILKRKIKTSNPLQH
jgi:hypothetical protein